MLAYSFFSLCECAKTYMLSFKNETAVKKTYPFLQKALVSDYCMSHIPKDVSVL